MTSAANTGAMWFGYAMLGVLAAMGSLQAVAWAVDRLSRGWRVTHLFFAAAWLILRQPELVRERRDAMFPACGACGSRDSSVKQRGWHDDGDPMPTCASCGGPS